MTIIRCRRASSAFSSAVAISRGAVFWPSLLGSKYPPAEPGALVLEPLKAACPCRSSQVSLHSVNASPSAEPPQLGKLRYLLSTWCALISIIIHRRSALSGARRLTIQSFIDGPLGFDFLKCQTFAPGRAGGTPILV